ncbi:hypothetical protein BT69DRAFT_1319275 [Atractiella rhizophila]|nr:hypothetical protein BT69DRAFT_1319275 [Atractiella rhizophila]
MSESASSPAMTKASSNVHFESQNTGSTNLNPSESRKGAFEDQNQGPRATGDEGASDAPPPGEDYPPQLHAGKLEGVGPEYHNEHKFSSKMTGVKEQMKGHITRNHDLVNQGKERYSGELAQKEREHEQNENPFGNAGDDDDKEQQKATDAPTGEEKEKSAEVKA